jgi:hypothetical protein
LQLFTYITYGIALLGFLVLAGFAVTHALKHEYISPRVKPVTWIFIVVSAVLIAISLYFLATLQF